MSFPAAVWERVKAEEARVRQAHDRRTELHLDLEASWVNPQYLYRRQERERDVLGCLHRLHIPFAETRVLEVGCGTGGWLRELVRWGIAPEHIWGIDLVPGVVAEARQRCPEAVHVQCNSVTDLPFRDATFDVVLQATLFTSLLDKEVRRVAAHEMLRVLRHNGVILWYDFFMPNPWNPDVRRVGRREIRALFPGCSVELRTSTLAPPLARRVAGSHMLYQLLASLPCLCTHYLGVIRPSAAPGDTSSS
jgi:ubiquinone/menaquinone biosynthesis C-methylase UbiE